MTSETTLDFLFFSPPVITPPHHCFEFHNESTSVHPEIFRELDFQVYLALLGLLYKDPYEL